MKVLPILDAAEIGRLVPLVEAVAALRQAFASSPTHAPRTHLTAPGAEFLVMPAAGPSAFGTKLVTIRTDNGLRNLPIIQGLYVLLDARDGQAVALLDGTALTTLRTPAVSAVATDALARADVRSVGILGTGPQAAAHPDAIRAVRPSIDTVVVAGRSPHRIDAIVAALRADGFDARSGTFAAAASCDVVCACTRSAAALFELSDVQAGAHLNLVGSYRLDLREVGGDVVGEATVVVDEIGAAKAEAGDLALAVEEGMWTWERVAGDLSDVAAGRVRRTSQEEITLFKSVGLAVQDLVVAELAARKAGFL